MQGTLAPQGHWYGDPELLAAVIDRIVPADAFPSASGFGAGDYLADAPAGQAAKAVIAAGLARLAITASSRYGLPYHEIAPERQDELLREVEQDHWFTELTALVAEGVYADPGNGGNRDASSWAMIGYRHGIPEGPSGPARRPPKSASPPPGWEGEEYDVIVIGAGAAGGIAACVLAEQGKRVLLLERGKEHSYETSGHRDHLRNHRYSKYGHTTGPECDGNPRVFVDPAGNERVVRPNEPDYSNIASGVGSGTLLYGGLAWRFLRDDFRMASRYGVPEGSSLVDWPIGYEDLEPFYERAEWEIGVAGETGDLSGHRIRYPMPPVPRRAAASVLAKGAASLGFDTFSPPILVNTVARAGRAACMSCGSCVGFLCPSNAKNGTQNTVIPRALASGHCTLVTGTVAERIEQNASGKVIGVATVRLGENGEPSRAMVRARAVMVCAGAIETARLLLASASPAHPMGLGNAHDQVGRHLQGHYYPTAYGLFDADVHDGRGPGVSIATCDFNHGNDNVIGGAMLADDFVMPPIIFWSQALPPDLPRWGAAAKAFMRDNFRRVLQVKGPVHEIPSPDCRVTLDSSTRDMLGRPVAKLSGTTHPETVRTANYILDKAHEWLRQSGAMATWGPAQRLQLSAGQHQAGTCRMGTDPRTSVTDPYGRVWGHDNLFISDGSIHPTNGGFNPVLTIMALAFRNAAHLSRVM